MKSILSRFLILLVAAFLLSACSIPFLNSQKAGVQITSSPQVEVFLDGQSLGTTPIIREDLKAGSYTLKMVAKDPTLLPWEGQIDLNAGVITALDRQLAADPNQVTGFSLTFEKINNKDGTQVSITTAQNNVAVAIDGSPAGFTPLSNDAITPQAHIFTLTSPGSQDKVIKASLKQGYKLVIFAQLATQTINLPTPTPTPEANPEASSSASLSPDKPYVEIKQTSLLYQGRSYLRVRSEPKITNSPNNEVGKAFSGEKYPYLTSQSGWYQIEYSAGKTGWIHGDYAQLVQ